jgi:hypothetical protein
MTTSELFTRFSAYVREFERLKRLYPAEIVAKEPVFSKRDLKHWPVLAEEPRKWLIYLEDLVECLDEFCRDMEEPRKLRVLYEVLDNYDSFFAASRNSGKIITDVRGADSDLFLKNAKFWKLSRNSPIDFSRSFTTFGLYEPSHPVEFFDLDEVIGELPAGATPVEPVGGFHHLDIGLFPLSPAFRRSFKVTRILNNERKIHGFTADGLKHPDFRAELDGVITQIRDIKLQIACFPELVLNEEARAYLTHGIRELNLPFFILIAGSDHRPDEKDSYKNTIPVLIFSGGAEIPLTYSKLEAFHVELREKGRKDVEELFTNLDEHFPKGVPAGTYFREDMVPDLSLLLIRSVKFGDMGFVICKDFLPDSNEIIRNYNRIADHLFIVALNVSEQADFRERSMHIVKEHGVAVFYVNSRAYPGSERSPSFYITPLTGQPFTLPETEDHCVVRLPRRELPAVRNLPVANVVKMSHKDK